MKFIEGILLYCLEKLNGERSIYSIFHLLKGKKSSQTIQDAHLFDLTKYFGVYRILSRDFLDKTIQAVYQKKMIDKVGEQSFVLTEQGKKELGLFVQNNPFLSSLDGWKYQQSGVFWERLALLLQVISNLVYGETRYQPIQKNKDVHYWIKKFLENNRFPRRVFGKKLFAELVDCLEQLEDVNPAVLVHRLTGFHTIGLTANQTAEKLHIEATRYHFEFLSILHSMIHQLREQPSRFPLLYQLVADTQQNLSLTMSARQTFSFVNQGYSLEEIAKLRRLKRNTIEDHIVEIALNVEQFSIDKYIDRPAQAKIMVAAQQEGTRQLKQIRTAVKTASYFEIRLVLAKYGAGQC